METNSIANTNMNNNIHFNQFHFYKYGESTHPTHSILSNLTYYQTQWESLQVSEGFDQTYSFTISWDCAAPTSSGCNECLQANKFIKVQDDTIRSCTISILNTADKQSSCSNTNISEYNTIDQLYQMTVEWISECLESPEANEQCTIIQLMLDPIYYFPKAVKLNHENGGYIAWTITCFEPMTNQNEEEVCQYTPGSNGNREVFLLHNLIYNIFRNVHSGTSG